MAEEHFVDKHRAELIQSVTNITPVLDGLLSCDVINKRSYDEIMSIPDPEGKMRALLSGPLKSSGDQGEKIFFNILEAHEPCLMADLKREGHENIKYKVPVATMKALEKILTGLSDWELERFSWFLQLTCFQKGFPYISREQMTARANVFWSPMVELCGQPSVEVAVEVFMDMNRTDLVQRLSGTSSGLKDEHFVDKHKLELIRRVTNIASILDELLDKKVIDDEKWEEIRKMPTPNAKMREVYICLKAGDECKNIFFEILKRQEKFLIEDLQKKK